MDEQLQELEMKFDPRTIEHLGLRMYSTLPPALAELISNSYDADASQVIVKLIEPKGGPKEIQVQDDGEGLSYDEINEKFLVIGRNRRIDGDKPSAKYHRLPTGKKGLGKLALFGLAKIIIINTVKNGLENEFILSWDELMDPSIKTYKPKSTITDRKTKNKNGTTIKLKTLKRVSPFDPDSLADNISRIFVIDENFKIIIETSSGNKIVIDNKRKYNTIDIEFRWDIESEPFIPNGSEYQGKIKGELLTTEKPLKPQSGLVGVTLFSRGKLVNAPEFFSNSTSSHFYQYLTGWLTVDFIDDLKEDVISTNRQSIDWDNSEMEKLRVFLAGIISQINQEWRKKRKDKKDKAVTEQMSAATGIDTARWISTMPVDVKKTTEQIIETLGGEDTTTETSVSVIKGIHSLVPEYPLLHWRHLHELVKEKSAQYYQSKDYYNAFLEAMKKYASAVKVKSGTTVTPDESMMGNVFADRNNILSVIGDYKKHDGTDFSSDTIKNVQSGQQFLSQGIVAGGRNPLSHEEHEELRQSDLFSESDCLNLLSLLSHLFKRLDNSKKVTP
ncbi:hypothetical protein FACS1894130_08140 [Spirochaetia bacterium]|nr:hypothetical protein FACS1894130_08140 [Spirochaetia bacterium]